MSKPKLGLYWAASCGGCEISVLEVHEAILDVAEFFDIVFWPVALDFKYKDVEAMADGEILLCMFNGAIRNEEQRHVAELLRRKSQVMVAHGACACWGGIPALGNVANREEIFDRAYFTAPSVDNPERVIPQTSTRVPEGELHLPAFFDTVHALDQVVPVEYYMPGCPPVAEQTLVVVTAVITGIQTGALPPPGSVIGAGEKTVCEECPREVTEDKKVKRFRRIHLCDDLDPKRCLLEQGVVCAGPATRSGCGAQCPKVNMPCRGCYGPAAGVMDQGTKLISALAAVIDAEDPEEVERIVGTIDDPLGYAYRFGLAKSSLKRVRISG
ncbi:MAG: oxidoreductase [Candidatus Zipacnadales bacterium]